MEHIILVALIFYSLIIIFIGAKINKPTTKTNSNITLDPDHTALKIPCNIHPDRIYIANNIYNFFSKSEILAFCHGPYEFFLKTKTDEKATEGFLGFIYMCFNFADSDSEKEIDKQVDLSHFNKNGNIYISSTLKRKTFLDIMDNLKYKGPDYDGIESVEQCAGNVYFVGIGIITFLEGGDCLSPCYILSV